jgi:hypothetical protein
MVEVEVWEEQLGVVVAAVVQLAQVVLAERVVGLLGCHVILGQLLLPMPSLVVELLEGQEVHQVQQGIAPNMEELAVGLVPILLLLLLGEVHYTAELAVGVEEQ